LIPVSIPDLLHILEGREAAQSFRKTVDLAQQHAERLSDPMRLFAQREPTCKSDYGKKSDLKIRLPRKATQAYDVEPTEFSISPEGEVVIEVHQVVRDLNGNLLTDKMVGHMFRIENGLIKRFDIRGQ
jgi:hypothetical protein